jgi:hypothetical protein
MPQQFWEVPELWPGQTVAIIGGGPSVTQAQVDYLKGRCRVIAVNDAYLLCPWADVLYFCDDRWWGWHHKRPEYQAFAGIKVTLENPRVCQLEPGVKPIRNMGREGLWPGRNGVMTGANSGYQGINLAVHFGAKRILLIGFDMHMRGGKSHWFGKHPINHPTKTDNVPGDYSNTMLPNFPTLLDPLKQLGVEVINCTPGSALTCFPMMSLEDALCHAPAA